MTKFLRINNLLLNVNCIMGVYPAAIDEQITTARVNIEHTIGNHEKEMVVGILTVDCSLDQFISKLNELHSSPLASIELYDRK